MASRMLVGRTGRRPLKRGLYASRAALATAAHPREGVERTVERTAEWWDVRHGEWHYDTTADWEERLQQMLGGGGPADDAAFDEVWGAAIGDLRTQGLATGRGAFGGWDDADHRLARLAWWLTRRLRPRVIVETGVARGLTTRVMLEALERNGGGSLWSIDLPPLIERHLATQTAAAVPPEVRGRWTLITGSSRRRLHGLVHTLPRVDLFVHDSLHTTRNVRFELEQVWPALTPTGAVLIDDVERNHATVDFVRSHPEAAALICPSEDGAVLIGVLVKRPATL